MSQQRDADAARPRFYQQAVQNDARSQAEGRPIFDVKEFVEVRIPGDRLFSFVTEVSDAERARWPREYEAFKRGEQLATTGTPLEHWPNAQLTVGRVAELKALHILSVEDLAGVPDSALSKMGMGARDLREQARAYLAAAKDMAANSAMAARLAQQDDQIARLMEQVAKLSAGNSASQPAAQLPLAEKAPEDCTDDELKAYIKRETGDAVRGTPSRETLIKRAYEIAAQRQGEAA